MSHQNTVWPVRAIAPAPPAPAPAPDTPPLLAWLAYGLLALPACLLFALACASAWLSYQAQVVYVLAHNGNLAAEARVWALLLDAGTAGISLLRLHEALHRRTNTASKVSLLGCIAASVIMNLLHTPSHSPGGYLVAAVPPVMYAVFLEHLLTNLRNVLVQEEAQHSMWRRSALWINFPVLMWSRHRDQLRQEAGGVSERSPSETGEQAHQAHGLLAKAPAQALRRGRGPGRKRIAFEAALMDQIQSGDLRLFSQNKRERNAAAYQAAASLPAPLSRGAARRYVVQALPRLNGGTAP